MSKYFYTEYNSKLITKVFFIKELKKFRKVSIYLPSTHFEGYRLPVIYMFDGENMAFSDRSHTHDSWNIPQSIETHIKSGQSKGFIVVAIHGSKNNESELNKFEVKEEYRKRSKQKPKADKLIKFARKKLKNYIDNHYRTKKDKDSTFVLGADYGANIALCTLFNYEEVYGGAGLFSLKLPYIDKKYKNYIEKSLISISHKVYFFVGGKESEDKNLNSDIYWETINLKNEIESRGVKCNFNFSKESYHTETTWAKIFPKFLDFISK